MKPVGKLVAAGLLCAGLVCVNYLASQLPIRADATEGKIYTLSPGTKAILDKIEEPVTLDFYYTRDTEGLPVAYKNYARRVEEMLRQYVRSAKGKIKLDIIHPAADTPEEERATAAGLQAQVIPGSGESVYLGLVAIQVDQQKSLPVLNPQRESLLEYDISSLIHSVQQVDKPRLGLITSLPLKGEDYNPMMMMGGAQPTPSQIVYSQWAQSYDIVPIKADATELPDHLDALAIIHPQGLGEALQFAIDQYLLADHAVFIAVDPASAHFRAAGGQQAMFGGMTPNLSSDLPTLFKAWGIDYDPQNIVGDPNLATPVNTGRGIARMPIWLSLTSKNLATGSPATAQLGSLLEIEGGSFSVKAHAGRTITPLLTTTDKAGTLPGYALQFADPDQINKQLSGSAQHTLAAIVSGPFDSAFPNGAPPPKKEGDESKDDAKAEKAASQPAANGAAPSLKSGQGTLVLIADTDWLLDDYSVRRGNFLGNQYVEPLNDNIAFASNLIDLIAGSSDLISLRGKTSSLRPFDVVNRLEAQAQERYQSKLDELEQQLLSVQDKLSKLQSKAPDGNRLVATPEVQKTIEEFREQEATLRRERRDIRRSLREDIDRLGHTLLAANLLAAPFALAAFGLWFQTHRRHRA